MRSARSGLTAVEGVFARLTTRRLTHGVSRSVVDLQAAIERSIAEHDAEEAAPVLRRAAPDAIIAAWTLGGQALGSHRWRITRSSGRTATKGVGRICEGTTDIPTPTIARQIRE